MNKGHTKNAFRKFFQILLYVFAIIGVLFAGVYVAMQLHLTNVTGSIDARNAYFNNIKKEFTGITTPRNGAKKKADLDPVTLCQIVTISSVLPENGQVILDTYISTGSAKVAQKMVRAVMIVTVNDSFIQNRINKCNVFTNTPSLGSSQSNQTIFDWIMSPEWAALHDALIKDQDTIIKASKASGIPARLIVSSVISEQFRFFTSNRESFKRYFEPLKILGNGTKFSYGVAGVKAETAQAIENYLKDPSSPFYLGSEYEHVFDYAPGEDPDATRLARLSDEKNHYYSYLYTGVFLRQIMNQWQKAGYPINDRPEVLATLFNLGFNKSVPKENPEIGGSTITINDRDYTFGGLSFEFYYSGELSDIFPLEVE